MKELRDFVKRKLTLDKFKGRQELILVAGDFNQNAGELNFHQLSKLYYIRDEPKY